MVKDIQIVEQKFIVVILKNNMIIYHDIYMKKDHMVVNEIKKITDLMNMNYDCRLNINLFCYKKIGEGQ